MSAGDSENDIIYGGLNTVTLTFTTGSNTYQFTIGGVTVQVTGQSSATASAIADAIITEYNKVGSTASTFGTISKDIKANSLWAVLGSLFVVFVYLMISFRKWQFGFAAVIAVAHDTIIVLGIFSFFYTILPFNMEIDQAFIAAILTVIGYSLNDTVIVFDRVREYLDYNSSPDFKGLVNKALNTTLSRTINTSATTLVVLVAIFIFGGETIRGFVFAILVGILVGTYSSLFIATPVMQDTIGEKEGRKMAEFKKED
jgi:SecD/SecF fusion protein